MPVQVNKVGYDHAVSLIRQGRYSTAGGWSWDADIENKILGNSDKPDWANYSKHFLAVDTSESAGTKARYKYPFIKDDDKVSRSGLIAVRQRSRQQQHAETIFSAAGRLITAIDVKEHGNSQQGKMIAGSDGDYFFTFDAQAHINPIAQASDPVTFGGIVYSGGLIPGFGELGNTVIDLTTATFPPSLMALVNHDPDRRAGFGCLVVNDGKLSVDGQLSKVTPDGKQITGEMSEGAPFQFSVGINAELERFDSPQSIVVNGQQLTVDSVFHNARVLEFSFVPAGADPNTHAALFSTFLDSAMTIESPQETTTMSDDEKRIMQSKIDEMQSKMDEMKSMMEQMSAKASADAETMIALRSQLRERDVKELFAALGREFSAESAKPYTGLDEISFSAIAADLKANVPQSRAPAYLFHPQTDGKPASSDKKEKGIDLAGVYSSREQARLSAVNRKG